MKDLTPIERAVVRMLAKPDKIPMPWADLPARFVVKATENPEDLLQMVFNAVDWSAIQAHMEQHA
ncbi:hypothetical protein [Thiocapsa sp. UBA6158]|uniref:hypothetical protein n=1 Tax=Thiocapsa sp. UBA6158 TaxID=1947692 RepID=UPI0025E9C23A|nr:hypothetical protein [Thiocapsa sp. UBA6158]